MTTLVAFGTEHFRLANQVLRRSARAHGFDHLRIWTPDELRATPFFAANEAILTQPRGAGYWLWKPFILADALANAPDGEAVVYADMGVRFVSSIAPVVELARATGDIVVFDGRGHFEGQAHRNLARAWTKRDCFAALGCDEPAFHDAPMVDASVVVAVSSPRSRGFVGEWLEACRDARALTDAPSELPNLPEHQGHLHDQAILTILARRHGLRAWRCPSQFGNHCKPVALRVEGEFLRRPYGSEGIDREAPYPTVCVLHRLRDFPLAQVGDVERTFAAIVVALAQRFERPKVAYLGRASRQAWEAACRALEPGSRALLWLDDDGPPIEPPCATAEVVMAPLTDAGVWRRLAGERFDAVVARRPPLDAMIPSGMLRSWRARPFLLAWEVDEDVELELGRMLPHVASLAGFDVGSERGLVGDPDAPTTVGVIERLPPRRG